MTYSQRTPRRSQFRQGCWELQAFFWRTQRSQARRRLEEAAEVPSQVCRWRFRTSVRWNEALQTVQRCGRFRRVRAAMALQVLAALVSLEIDRASMESFGVGHCGDQDGKRRRVEGVIPSAMATFD
jgi:hypothetical protein